METKRYVAGFAFRGDDVLLIKKARPEWQRGLLNGVGGSIEEGETPIEAMCREFLEEASLATSPDQWSHRVRLEAFRGGRLGRAECVVEFFRIYLDDRQRDAVQAATDERLLWVPVRDMWTESVIPNLRWLVPLCRDKDLDPLDVITVRDTNQGDGV